jgi:uncharacterized membrane protein
MSLIVRSALIASSMLPATAWGQGPGPWQMHDWMGWGWGGMWLGPLFMFALPIAAIVALVRWMGGSDGERRARARRSRDIHAERYAAARSTERSISGAATI